MASAIVILWVKLVKNKEKTIDEVPKLLKNKVIEYLENEK